MKRIVCLLTVILLVSALVACKAPEESGINFASLSLKGTVVAPDAEAGPVLAALGAYRDSAETPSCYGDGKDRVYEYTSFKVKTYSKAGKEYILAVDIFSDADEAAVTPEGIRVGASRDDVIATYGEATEADDFKLVYLHTDGNTKLQFSLRNGAVTNVMYLKADSN